MLCIAHIRIPMACAEQNFNKCSILRGVYLPLLATNVKFAEG